jgi:predicted aconitase with swiveling domain/predicted NUDIX family NTP pyrophosphohydrolase
MMIQGRPISKGKARGIVLKLNEPFSFLGGVDAATGELKAVGGGNLCGRIFVFPRGKGSTVGSFTMYDLKVHGRAPAAVINEAAETIVATGAVISSIPMADRIDTGLLRNGDDVTVDGNSGCVEIHNVSAVSSVSSAILVNGRILMLKRPGNASSFPNVWSLVAGKIEKNESVDEAAVREIFEETGLRVSSPSASLDPILVREKDIIWKVYPRLFVHDVNDVILNDENLEYRWVLPGEMEKMDTVTSTISAVKELLSKISI